MITAFPARVLQGLVLVWLLLDCDKSKLMMSFKEEPLAGRKKLKKESIKSDRDTK